jgi:hypothetical protein
LSNRRNTSKSRPWRTLLAPAGILAGLALASAALGMRATIVSAAPVSAQVYRMLGVPVNIKPLELGPITSRFQGFDSEEELIVEGELINQTSRRQTSSDLDIALKSESGDLLFQWRADVPSKSLQPGESLKFRVRLEKPPRNVRVVEVRLGK